MRKFYLFGETTFTFFLVFGRAAVHKNIENRKTLKQTGHFNREKQEAEKKPKAKLSVSCHEAGGFSSRHSGRFHALLIDKRSWNRSFCFRAFRNRKIGARLVHTVMSDKKLNFSEVNMTKTILKKGDGFRKQRPEYRDDVKILQRALIKAGFEIEADGLFGQGTEDSLKLFQKTRNLAADGVCGKNTWKAFLTDKAEKKTADEPSSPESCLEGFCGDLQWVHKREGHVGKPYWPGGESGVTLDPGVDLGYADPELIESLYADILSKDEMEAVKLVLGVKGEEAEIALKSVVELRKIRISRERAGTIFQYAAKPYWEKIVKRFDRLIDDDVPPAAQTAMLSLSYNRGPGNKGLEILKKPLKNKDWGELGNLISNMQQDHKLEGIKKRRRMEGELIASRLV